MSDDKKSSNSTNENIKVFNGELFVNNNTNDIDYETNNNSLRKSTSNSIGGSLSNNIRGSMKSNQSNGERFLTKSLMQDLRGSTKKFSDKKLEFDKFKIKDIQNQINSSQLSNNSNSNNNEEDFLANIKLPKNDNNQLKQIDVDDLYEEVENIESEGNKYEVEEPENNNNIYSDKDEEMNDIININKLTKLNGHFNKNKKNTKKFTDSKINEIYEPLSLRSSGGSACNSSHSNNSNGNMNMIMNMRSSKIFNKKEKNSPDKDNNDNNSGNIFHLDEGNLSENENQNAISNIINNEINENLENKKENMDSKEKENKEIKENKEEKERNEKIAKIKDQNNEQKFISKNSINVSNKNIKNINFIDDDEEDKKNIEMQLFNLDSILSEAEKEAELKKKLNIFPDFQNIMQTFEDSSNEETTKINDNKGEKKEEQKNINTEKVLDNEKELLKNKDNETKFEKDDGNKNELKKDNENEKELENDKKNKYENIFGKEKKKEIKNEPLIEKGTTKEMEKEEYVFEKFGKLGWECEKCNNFNFESRTICNRCEAPKQPKSLEQIKLENEQKSGEKKKKPLIERKGDWQCPLCHNLNFAFRVSCNRCKLPKEMYLNYSMKQKQQQKLNENIGNNINNINLQNNFVPQIPTNQIINNNAPQLIQNQFNIIQCGYLPVYNPYFSQNPFSQAPQQNMSNINNMNNYKRKHKFYKQ